MLRIFSVASQQCVSVAEAREVRFRQSKRGTVLDLCLGL